MDDLRDTASALELVWTLVTLTGVGFYLRALSEAVQDEVARRQKNVNGAREIITRSKIRRNAILAGIMLMLFLVGIGADLLPPRTVEVAAGPELTLATVYAVFAPLVFVLMVVLLVGDSALDNIERGWLVAIYERQAAAAAVALAAREQADEIARTAAKVEKIDATTTATQEAVKRVEQQTGGLLSQKFATAETAADNRATDARADTEAQTVTITEVVPDETIRRLNDATPPV